MMKRSTPAIASALLVADNQLFLLRVSFLAHGLNGPLSGRLRLVEPPWLDVALKQLVELGRRKAGRQSQRLVSVARFWKGG